MTLFSVVVPAFQAEGTLGACLGSIRAAGFDPSDVIVVDDGSRDATGRIAAEFGAAVVRNEVPQRPARARNLGVARSDAEVILFVDADVLVHRDVRVRLERHFADPELAAVIGSYDDAPPRQSRLSVYRNLLHHHTHQQADAEAATFWTGLGAVRRGRFLALGGLDRAWEDIEDVEFGLRLAAAGGRIRLDHGLLGTHLKDWSLRTMLRTDFWGRAVPWTRLLVARRAGLGSLNTARRHQAATAAVVLALGSLPVALIAPAALFATVLAVAAFCAANARFFHLLLKAGGPQLLAVGLPSHALHYLAALGGFLYVRVGGGRSR